MSYHAGKKATFCAQTFNKTVCDNTFANLAWTLQKRKLGNKHFEQADQYIAKIRQAAPLKVIDQYNYDPGTKLSDRRLAFLMAHMNILKNEEGEILFDQYIPAVINCTITESLLYYANRMLPLTLSSDHIEHRVIQRTGQVFQHDSADFQYTVSTALMLSTILSATMAQKNETVIPVVVPDSAGFYLGYAVRYMPQRFWPLECIIASNSSTKQNGAPLLHGLHKEANVVTQPAWSPNVQINIRTFISKSEFLRDQADLHDVFCNLLTERATPLAYTDLFNNYAKSFAHLSHDYSRQAAKFQKIVESQLWRIVTDHGKKHIPEMNDHHHLG